ncbi:hypothetical protein IV203_014553 [Nitzschia inconspicua]|uniref:Uncharacterized protein n=1 Tax=Nitzschia inconspicua TaxID=303405 RepID=A0A9K3LAU4_9STRA|nr:hypothetical protein IV203_014553 [Nitzschia inconspicua]
MEGAKSEIDILNYDLAKHVPMELEDDTNTCDAGEGAFAESDGEYEFGKQEASNGVGTDQQRDESAQQALGLETTLRTTSMITWCCLHRTCGVTIKHHTSGSYHASTLGCIANWSRWRDINSNDRIYPQPT